MLYFKSREFLQLARAMGRVGQGRESHRRKLLSSEGAAEGGVWGIPPRPSVPPEQSGGGQSGFSAKWVLTFSNKHHQIELDESLNPTIETIQRIAKALDVSIDDLLKKYL